MNINRESKLDSEKIRALRITFRTSPAAGARRGVQVVFALLYALITKKHLIVLS